MLQTRYYFEKEFTPYDDILRSYPHLLKRYARGDELVKPGELFDLNHYLLKGIVKVAVLHETGEEKIIAYFGPQSIYPIIAHEKPFILETSIVVQAITDVETMAFTFAETRTIMRAHPEIAEAMIDHYCKFTNYLFYQETSQAYEPLMTRVCDMLYICEENLGSESFELSQSDLARAIGATRSSVVRVLAKLREEGIIKTKRNEIIILDRQALVKHCSVLTTD